MHGVTVGLLGMCVRATRRSLLVVTVTLIQTSHHAAPTIDQHDGNCGLQRISMITMWQLMGHMMAM